MKEYRLVVLVREADGWPRALGFECRANSLAMARAMARAQAAIAGRHVVSISTTDEA